MSVPIYNLTDVYTEAEIVIFEVVFYAALLLVLITFPIYCVVVAVLMCGKKQAGSNNIFFRIYMIGGIVDIIAMFTNYVLCAFPQRGWYLSLYTSSIGFGKAYLMISWSIRYAQAITAVLLAFNRLTALVFPAKYKTLWSPRAGLVVHALQIFPPSLICASLAFTTYYYEYNDQGGVNVQFADAEFRTFVFTIGSSIQTIFIVYMVVNYVVVFVYFRKAMRGGKERRKDDKEKQKQENRLLYIAIVVCSLEIISWLYSVYAFLINTKIPTRLFYCIYNLISEVYASTPPYLLILFSTPFQKRLKAFLRLPELSKKPAERTSTSTVTSYRAAIKPTRY